MVDGLLPRGPDLTDQFPDGDHGTVRGPDGQPQQFFGPALILGRQAQHDGRGPGMAVAQDAGLDAVQAGPQGLDDGFLRDAGLRGAFAVHGQHHPRCGGDAAVVDVHHAPGPLEHLTHGAGQRLPAGRIGAVDFRHDGCQDRRAGGHFDDLDFGAKPGGGGLQDGPDPHGDVVALRIAPGLVHQIDLDVAERRIAPQVVLTDQSVEVDGRGRAGIGLDVGDFGLGQKLVAQCLQHGVGPFQRRAGRHLHHDLEFGFVVEGQHFQLDPAQDGHQHRAQDQRQDGQSQPDAIARGARGRQERIHQALEDALRTPRPCGRVRGGVTAHAHGEPWRQGQGDAQGDQHPHAGIDRDGAHVGAHQSRDEGHRQQRGDDGESGQDGGAAHFVDGHRNAARGGEIGAQAGVPVDVFHDDDGVVHQDADGENEREQRDPVQGESPGPGGEQRGGQRQADRQSDDDGLAPAQGQKDQQDHRQRGEDQLVDQRASLGVSGGAVIAGFRDLDIGRNDGVAQRLHAAHQAVGDVDGVFAGFFGDCQGHGGFGVALAPCRPIADIVVGGRRIFGDVGDLAQAHGSFAAPCHDQFGDILASAQEPARVHRQTLVADDPVAGAQALIGVVQSARDILDRHSRGGHAAGVQVHADRVFGAADQPDVAGAGDTLEVGLDAAGDPFQIARRGEGGVQRQCDDRDVVDASRLDEGRPDAETFGQPAGRLCP